MCMLLSFRIYRVDYLAQSLTGLPHFVMILVSHDQHISSVLDTHTHLQCLTVHTASVPHIPHIFIVSWTTHLQCLKLSKTKHGICPEIVTWFSALNTGNARGRTAMFVLTSCPWWCDENGSSSPSELGSALITSILCSECITSCGKKELSDNIILALHFIQPDILFYRNSLFWTMIQFCKGSINA